MIVHRAARIVGEQLRRSLQEAHEPIVQRRQLKGREADPVRQRRAIDPHAFTRQDLRLTVKGKVVGIFRDEHVSDERLRRQTALDQPVRGRSLHHAVGAAAAGIFRPPRHDHAQARRDLVKPLRDVLADDVQSATTARASFRLRLDDDLLARQMRRQAASVGAPGFRSLGPDDVAGLLGCGILGAMPRLDVLKGQLDLVLADPLRATAELRAAKNRDDMIEALGTRSQSLYLGREKLTFLLQTFALGIEPGILGPCRQDHRLQRLGIVGQIVR
jgi:hypothetical protein